MVELDMEKLHVMCTRHTTHLKIQAVIAGTWCTKWLAMYIYIWIHTQRECINDQNGSYAKSHVALACHLYFEAAGALPAVHGVMYKNFTLLVLLHFSLI